MGLAVDTVMETVRSGVAPFRADLPAIYPELAVAGVIAACLMVDLLVPRRAEKDTVAWVAVMGLAVAFAALAPLARWNQTVFHGMIRVDALSLMARALALAATAGVCALAAKNRDFADGRLGEFVVMALAACLGMMLLSSANNLLLLYIGIEFVSLPCYVMTGYLTRRRLSGEAGMKYAIYGGLASGLMVFGISLAWAATGSLDIAEVGARMLRLLDSGAVSDRALLVIPLLIFVGIGYKIAAVPFHFWCPDVYEGAPTVATAFFSVGPKVAGFAALLRVWSALFPAASNGVWLTAHPDTAARFLEVVAILTMTVGNLTALFQHNAKRMLAFSSVAHSGYILAALAVPLGAQGGGQGFSSEAVREGTATVLYYLVAYFVMNLGAFAVVSRLEELRGGADLEDLRGAGRAHPALAVAMCIFLFSLIGLPPTGGFMGKWFILKTLVGADRWLLAGAVVVNSVIALYYYVSIMRTLTIDDPGVDAPSRNVAPNRLVGALIAGLAAATIALQGLFGPFYRAGEVAAAELWKAAPRPSAHAASETRSIPYETH